MSRLAFTLIWIALASGLLLFMALAWRARTRRDAGLAVQGTALVGPAIEKFAQVAYVSTTPAGKPFERVAVPGLSFKGSADVTVQTDGVAIEVVGEPRIALSAAQITGVGAAGGRVGKVVERDGLAILSWNATDAGAETRALESSFRFATPAEQHRFTHAVNELVRSHHKDFQQPNHTSQEDS